METFKKLVTLDTEWPTNHCYKIYRPCTGLCVNQKRIQLRSKLFSHCISLQQLLEFLLASMVKANFYGAIKLEDLFKQHQYQGSHGVEEGKHFNAEKMPTAAVFYVIANRSEKRR